MHDERSPDHREVKGATEVRQGEVSKDGRVRRVLAISDALTVAALLIIYLAFAS